MENSEIIKHIYSFLSSHQLMAIATYGDSLWIANVYYGVDEKLNLYFISTQARLHSQHISQNPQVACGIYDSTLTPKQSDAFEKVGVQLTGSASIVTDQPTLNIGLRLWKNALDITSDEYFSVDRLNQESIPEKLYRVTPKKIKLFHDELFDEEHVPLIEMSE